MDANRMRYIYRNSPTKLRKPIWKLHLLVLTIFKIFKRKQRAVVNDFVYGLFSYELKQDMMSFRNI